MPFFDRQLSQAQIDAIRRKLGNRLGPNVDGLLSRFEFDNAQQGYSQVQGQVQDRYNELRDPGFGLQSFLDLAGRSAPTVQTLLRAQAAGGGSPVIAQQQFEAAQKAAQQQALDSFAQFRLGTTGQANNLLGLMQQGQQFQQSEQLAYNAFQQQRRDQSRRDRQAFIGGLIGTGIGALTGGAFGGAPQQQPSQVGFYGAAGRTQQGNQFQNRLNLLNYPTLI